MTPDDISSEIWNRRDEQEVRDLIIMAYWPMLKRVVGRIRQGLPPHVRVEEDDLRSYGLIGLYKALDRFDPTLGFAFDKYASNFVRGAVLDELRSQDWAPRSLRKRQKDLQRAVAELTTRLERRPSEEELAEHLDWQVTAVADTRRQVDASWPRSLDEIRGEAEKDLYATVSDSQGDPEQHALGVHDSHENDRSSILNDKMSGYIDQLPPQKRAILVFSYFLDLRQTDMAAALGIPESRVSVLHAAVLSDFHRELEKLLVENG